MNRESIEQKALELCAEIYGRDVTELTMDTTFEGDLSPASILRVSLSANIEEELDVMIPLAEVSKFKTIGELVDYIVLKQVNDDEHI